MFALIPVVHAVEEIKCEKCKVKRLPKAHELPLYEPIETSHEIKKTIVEPGALEHGIGIARTEISGVLSKLDGVWKKASEIYNTGVAHSKNTYDYIRHEENVAPRILSIAGGGLTGMLLGIRGGLFKKIMYSSLGAGIVASACYPNEAKEYTQRGFAFVTNKTSTVIKEQTGYDIEKMTSDAKDKVSSSSATVTVQNTLNSVKDIFKKIYPLDKMADNKLKPKETLEDHGQSNPKDADLYTTRS